MSLGVAFRAFFAALSNSSRSNAIRQVLDADIATLEKETARLTAPAQQPEPTPAKPADRHEPKRAARSEALTLLSVLQREARLVDLVSEPLDQYGDAQVGAAARPCLKQCRQALQRLFDLQPLLADSENAVIDVPENASAVRFQWVGDSGSGKTQGKLVHPGWIARKVELPQWTGVETDASVVAAAEVERV